MHGTAGHNRLNRPKALNSLSMLMVWGLDASLRRVLAGPAVATIVLSGAGERVLCVWGDIRALVASLEDGPAGADAFWRDEYHLFSRIARVDLDLSSEIATEAETLLTTEMKSATSLLGRPRWPMATTHLFMSAIGLNTTPGRA